MYLILEDKKRPVKMINITDFAEITIMPDRSGRGDLEDKDYCLVEIPRNPREDAEHLLFFKSDDEEQNFEDATVVMQLIKDALIANAIKLTINVAYDKTDECVIYKGNPIAKIDLSEAKTSAPITARQRAERHLLSPLNN